MKKLLLALALSTGCATTPYRWDNFGQAKPSHGLEEFVLKGCMDSARPQWDPNHSGSYLQEYQCIYKMRDYCQAHGDLKDCAENKMATR